MFFLLPSFYNLKSIEKGDFLYNTYSHFISAQQLIFEKCSTYKPINASDYDMHSSSPNPLGYYSSSLPYMDGQKVTPCVEVTGIPSTAYIEIKVENIPSLMFYMIIIIVNIY